MRSRAAEGARARAARLLAQHVDAGHAVRYLDTTTARCDTCSHTLLLDGATTVRTASDHAAVVDRPAGPGVCPSHPGELAHACRCCRADRLAAEPGAQRQAQLDLELVERNTRGLAAVRAALAARGGRA